MPPFILPLLFVWVISATLSLFCWYFRQRRPVSLLFASGFTPCHQRAYDARRCYCYFQLILAAYCCFTPFISLYYRRLPDYARFSVRHSSYLYCYACCFFTVSLPGSSSLSSTFSRHAAICLRRFCRCSHAEVIFALFTDIAACRLLIFIHYRRRLFSIRRFSFSFAAFAVLDLFSFAEYLPIDLLP